METGLVLGGDRIIRLEGAVVAAPADELAAGAELGMAGVGMMADEAFFHRGRAPGICMGLVGFEDGGGAGRDFTA